MKLCRPEQVRPAEYLLGDHRSFCSGILRRFHVTTSILRPGHQERERTLLFMESAKPTMFLEPTVAAAARGQVLVRARVAVRRATESMVLIDLVVYVVLILLCALLVDREREELRSKNLSGEINRGSPISAKIAKPLRSLFHPRVFVPKIASAHSLHRLHRPNSSARWRGGKCP